MQTAPVKTLKIPKEIWAALSILALSIAAYVTKYLLNVFLAQHLSPENYGDLAIAIRALTIFSTITLLGTGTSSKLFLANYLKTQDASNIRNYLRWNLRVVAYTFTTCFVFAIISLILMLYLHYTGINDINDYHLAIYMLWVAPLAALTLLLSSFLACNNHTIIAQFCQSFAKFVLLALFFVSSVLLFKLQLTDLRIIFILLSVFSILVLFEVVLLRYKAPILFSINFRNKNAIPKDKHQKWLKVSSRLIANNIIFLMVCVMDLVIVELLSPDERDVGYYAAVLAISSFIWLIPRGVYQFIKPSISSLIKTQDKKVELQRQLNSANLIMLSVTSLMTIGLLIFANDFLMHFGKAYLIAKIPLIIMIIGNFIGAFSRSSALLLAYSGYESSLLKINYVEIALILILGLILTHYYGIFGMAVATASSVTIKTIIIIYHARKYLKMRPLSFI